MREHAAHLLGRLAATLDNSFVCLGGVGHAFMVSAGVEATSIRLLGQQLGQHAPQIPADPSGTRSAENRLKPGST
jgi:hypothetical protein